jgi:hypothetical protein
VDRRARRSEGAKRAIEGRQRSQGLNRSRRNRKRLSYISGIVAIVVLAVSARLIFSGPDVGESVAILGGVHNTPYNYNTMPPTSGNHTTNPAPYGFSVTALRPETVVHNMEHGAVVIWFDPTDLDLVDDVKQLTDMLGQRCLLATPYADMKESVAVTAWGRILRVDGFDEEHIREFVDAYRGKLGPEAGNCLVE